MIRSLFSLQSDTFCRYRCFHNLTLFKRKFIKLIWLIHHREFIIIKEERVWMITRLTHTHRRLFRDDWHDLMVNLFTSNRLATRSIYRLFNFLTCCSNCCKSLPAAATLHKYSPDNGKRDERNWFITHSLAAALRKRETN